ncbi:IS110 family transposase [Paenibacillus albiflavus]|uniref:IS110 family transposase n=1 Tax=Paenibacillus albiflavus TaxID=2545760 RepID=A0A4V2WPH1_9BACL|nr:IS110 family transposase [Paenibacillus albiflavus]TCZ79362.1 IS110 family transposase [Paenibacillus albiflavus]
MQQPVLSIDVAKGKSVAATFSAYGSIVCKPFTFSHSPEGISSLLPHLVQLEKMTHQRPSVVLEATGHYSKPIVSYFNELNYPVVVLNPLLTHQLKKKSTRKIKTDPIDAMRIAQTFYLEQAKAIAQPSAQIANLQLLCRQYTQWSSMYTDAQLHFRAVLDLIFPGYDKAFQNICNPTSLTLLQTFPTPNALLHADSEDIMQILLHNRRGRSWNEQKLVQIRTIAQQSLPDPQATVAQNIAINHYIQLLKSYQSSITDLQNQMKSAAESLAPYHLLKSIPGVGPLTAATIVAEIGDIKRFPSVKQLTAFAGLDSSVYQSGTFKSNQNHISKRGSSYLRTALYQATVAGISKQVNGPRNEVLSRYYQQKLSEGKASKVAIVATSNKLLRIIFGVWRSETPFRIN